MRAALITGAAGFIGSHLVGALLAKGWRVVGLDNFDPFYSVAQKERNLEPHCRNPQFEIVRADIRDSELCRLLSGRFDVIVHLAAKAGVRPSIQDPLTYQDVNVRGAQAMLELAKIWGVHKFVFASSSSVYGVNPRVPWSEEDHVLSPISPYASTKVSGELLGHVYSHLYGIRFLALRFFTVFGPRQRPDLAIHKFARSMRQGQPIPVFGDGATRRDYTFVSDIVDGILAAIDYDQSRYEVINLGSNRPISLLDMIGVLQEVTGLEAILQWLPDQPGDVPQTYADLSKARRLLGYEPKTDFQNGVGQLWKWLTSEAASLPGDHLPRVGAVAAAPGPQRAGGVRTER